MDNKFIVGVIGTQNTGKSTFIKDIISKYQDTDSQFQTVGCDYRKKIEEAGLQINRNGNLRCQKIICDTLIEQLDIIKGMGDGNYITDRSPIDAYAYTVYLYRHNPELGIKKSDLDEMLDKVRESIKTYDKIIYIDVNNCDNVQVVDDRFRDTNLEYRNEVDSIFKETFNLLGEDVMKNRLVSEIMGSRESRVNMFVKLFGWRMVHLNGD